MELKKKKQNQKQNSETRVDINTYPPLMTQRWRNWSHWRCCSEVKKLWDWPQHLGRKPWELPDPFGVSSAPCDAYLLSLVRSQDKLSWEVITPQLPPLTRAPGASRVELQLLRNWLGFHNQESSPPESGHLCLPRWSWEKQLHAVASR